MIRILAASLLLTATAAAQSIPNTEGPSIPVAVRFVATEANAPPGSCGCFWLSGAGVDAAVPVTHHISAALDFAGTTTKLVPGTTRGLSVLRLMAGPRYSVAVGRRATVHAQALFGVARGFDADFITGASHTDTASVFGMAFGGSVELSLSRSVSLRPVQVDYLQTHLPNGSDDRQRNLRIGAGVVFRVKLPRSR